MDIPIVLAPNDSFHEHAAVGLHVDFGSADESLRQRGHAHLLEHVLVRTHFPDSLALKAKTGRERTSFQLVTKASEVGRTVEELAEIIHRRIGITREVLAEEKGIVAREIAERRHTKSWRVRESTFSALWGGTPYSHDPLGNVDDWTNSDVSSLEQILEQHYLNTNAVLVIAGDAKLEDRLQAAKRTHSFTRAGRAAISLGSPKQVRLHWGKEELGHVIAWDDSGAQPRARLVNRMGKAKFQQLALRQGWLTWVWVPPNADPQMTVESQLAATLLMLSESKSRLLSEYRCAEIKRSEQVEAVALETVDGLWAGRSPSSPLTLTEGVEHWRSLIQGVGS